jgi:acetoin utilization protein AcuB
MIVSMWMTREVVTIERDTPITEAAAIMAERHIRRLPVVEHRAGVPHPVGIITATDILHAYPPEVNPFAIARADARQAGITAEHIMSHSLQTITPETAIEDAAQMMRNEKISTLLVVQKLKLIGLITESDIFRAFVSIFTSAQSGARITFEVAQDEDVFGLIAPVALRFGVQVASLISMQQGSRKLCVVRITGAAVEEMINELWRSGHNVLNVLRLP